MIPVADIELQRELEDSAHRREHKCIRRVYSAKIGRRSDFTVAMYQGNSAEEEWRRDIERYMSIRHPNIIQIWAGASYGKLHATVFHGDLVPFKEFLARRSPILTVYFYALYTYEWVRVQTYLRSALSRSDVHPWEYTLWIHSSTGQLTADMQHPEACDQVALYADLTPVVQAFTDQDATAIEFLSLDQYHEICAFHLGHWRRTEYIPTTATATPGVITVWPDDVARDGLGVAFLPAIDYFVTGSWSFGPASGDLDPIGDLMESGWMRCKSHQFNGCLGEDVIVLHLHGPDFTTWLSQANHIFNSLDITSNLNDYVFLYKVEFEISLVRTGMTQCPSGYLFLCPQADFRIGATSCRWPDFPAYWTLDPTGVHRLSTEEATILGFPEFELNTSISGLSWDTSVYAGLRKFHAAKGFNPDSQDIARHIGLPLYELMPGMHPFVDTEEYEDMENEHWESAEESDWNSKEEDNIKTEGAPAEEAEQEGTDGDHSREEFGSDNQPQQLQTPGACSGPGKSGVQATNLEFHLHATDEDIPVILEYLNGVRLALILFLAMCWVYDNM
ncbi:hypothetical protein C8R46DRAFT_1107821 [Mycena filopes]|nr:hypothetical protein C8R46DRAFT_1107821 [Mycena filopes]